MQQTKSSFSTPQPPSNHDARQPLSLLGTLLLSLSVVVASIGCPTAPPASSDDPAEPSANPTDAGGDQIETDAGPTPEDLVDAGSSVTPQTDGGTVVSDAGVAEVDAGVIDDAGVENADAGAAVDGGANRTDSGTLFVDGGANIQDGGESDADGGSGTSVDAGTDAGAGVDAGVDAGAPPTDAGVENVDAGPGTPTCNPAFSAVDACGGDVVGTWDVDAVCIDNNTAIPPEMQALVEASCVTAAVSLSDVQSSGTLSFDGAQQYTNSVTATIIIDAVIPGSCIASGVSVTFLCGPLAVNLQMDSSVQSARCTANPATSSCDCSITSVPTTSAATGAYAVDGNGTLTFDPGTLTASDSHYCIDGQQMTQRQIYDVNVEGAVVTSQRR